MKIRHICASLLAACLVAGCAEAPQPIFEPLKYEDPAVPPSPVVHTDRIRDAAVMEATGSRGGAALRAQEDLDVLHNAHYEGVELPVTDSENNRSASVREPKENAITKQSLRGGKLSVPRQDKSIYSPLRSR